MADADTIVIVPCPTCGRRFQIAGRQLSEKVGNTDDLSRIIDKHQVGDTISVEVMRNGKRVKVPVRLTEAPDTRRVVR